MSHLRFETMAGGGSLDYVFVKCHAPGCGRRRSLSDLMDLKEVKRLRIRCPGTQPWESPRPPDSCDAVPVILQRGATNLTFHITESSIDIPPWSEIDYFDNTRLAVTSHPSFKHLKSQATHSDEIISFVTGIIATDVQLEHNEIMQVIKAELARGTGSPIDLEVRPVDRPILLEEEYEAFLKPDRINTPVRRFRKRLVDPQESTAELSGPYGAIVSCLFARVGSLVKVLKLREVRALRGFSRLGPPEGMESEEELPGRFEIYDSSEKIAPRLVSPSLYQPLDWLPALEVYGEGIFFTLDEARLREWEKLPEVSARLQTLESRFDPRVHPALANTRADARTVLLHTLSHLVIRQLSFECGYAIASLRERVYSGAADANLPMAGVLIYTAAGDAEGTLGGLVREASADRFASTVLKSLQLAEWCSSDPLCRESRGQGLGNLNLAACHACALLPETSCTLGNRLLDRTLVTGLPGQRTLGFFGDLVDASLAALTEAGA